MDVALFVPCYINQFYPQVAIATLELLEKTGCRVHFPLGQTCCGQPLANAGFAKNGHECLVQMEALFAPYDWVVAPSASCVLYAKEHAPAFQGRLFELCEFLTDVLKIQSLDARFPYRVALHTSCHGLRGLRLAGMSERVETPFSKPAFLLNLVRDLQLVGLQRPDECCGFGGTFSVTEEAVSAKMGLDRLADFHRSGAEVIAGTDISCLMHLSALRHPNNPHHPDPHPPVPPQFLHIAEILNQ